MSRKLHPMDNYIEVLEEEEEEAENEEDIASEKEALTEVKDDELRTKLASEMGVDPDTEGELLDKLVAKEKASRERTSKAIKQKIKYREQLKKTSEKSKSEPSTQGKTQTPEEQEALIDRKVNEKLEERDLAALDLKEELKQEVKDLAKLKGISIKEAANLPYIKSRQEEIEREAKILDASPKRKGGGNYQSTYDVSKGAPSADDFDLDSEEGRKAYGEAKNRYREARKNSK